MDTPPPHPSPRTQATVACLADGGMVGEVKLPTRARALAASQVDAAKERPSTPPHSHILIRASPFIPPMHTSHLAPSDGDTVGEVRLPTRARALAASQVSAATEAPCACPHPPIHTFPCTPPHSHLLIQNRCFAPLFRRIVSCLWETRPASFHLHVHNPALRHRRHQAGRRVLSSVLERPFTPSTAHLSSGWPPRARGKPGRRGARLPFAPPVHTSHGRHTASRSQPQPPLTTPSF